MSDPIPNLPPAQRPRHDDGRRVGDPPPGRSDAALTGAILWAIAATIAAAWIFLATPTERYGADAYTGIQNAIVMTARAVAVLIFSTGVLGLLIVRRR